MVPFGERMLGNQLVGKIVVKVAFFQHSNPSIPPQVYGFFCRDKTQVTEIFLGPLVPDFIVKIDLICKNQLTLDAFGDMMISILIP